MTREELLKSPGYHLTGVQIDDDEISVQYTVLCGGREYKTKLKKGDRVKVGCYCGMVSCGLETTNLSIEYKHNKHNK